MAAGVRGPLVSTACVEAVLASVAGAEAPPTSISRALEAWAERREAALGPASSTRAIADIAIVPLLKILGYAVASRTDEPASVRLEAVASSGALIPVVIVPWNESLERTWRTTVLDGIRADARWCAHAPAWVPDLGRN